MSYIRSEIRHDSITQWVHQIIIGKYGFPSFHRYIHLIKKKIINDLPYYILLQVNRTWNLFKFYINWINLVCSVQFIYFFHPSTFHSTCLIYITIRSIPFHSIHLRTFSMIRLFTMKEFIKPVISVSIHLNI